MIEHLTVAERSVVRSLIEGIGFELVPVKGGRAAAALLPEGSKVSVTVSPSRGIKPSIDLAVELVEQGFVVTPHLGARYIADRRELKALLHRLDEHRMRDALVVSGEVDPVGEFTDGLALLAAMEDVGHGLETIGVPCYPEGHPSIPDDVLDDVLHRKQPYATWMANQLCFEPETIAAWLARRRARGIELPLRLGVAGPSDLKRLIGIALRIGVGESIRFASKNTGLAGRLGAPGGYAPGDLVLALAREIADPRMAIAAIHVSTFNNIEETLRWRERMLTLLA